MKSADGLGWTISMCDRCDSLWPDVAQFPYPGLDPISLRHEENWAALLEQIPIQERIGFSHLRFCHECPRILPRTCSDSATNLQARMDSIRELLRADLSTNLPAQIWSDSRTNTVGFSHISSSTKGQSSRTFVTRFKHKSSSTNVWGFENEYFRIQPLVSRRLLVIFKNFPPQSPTCNNTPQTEKPPLTWSSSHDPQSFLNFPP